MINLKMKEALEFIAKWDLPKIKDKSGRMCSYEEMQGSNGARNYIIMVAKKALEEEQEAQEQKRANVEFKKCDDSIFELQADFNAKELYYRVENGYSEITSVRQFAKKFSDMNVYRKVTTKITPLQSAKAAMIEFANDYVVKKESDYSKINRITIIAGFALDETMLMAFRAAVKAYDNEGEWHE